MACKHTHTSEFFVFVFVFISSLQYSYNNSVCRCKSKRKDHCIFIVVANPCLISVSSVNLKAHLWAYICCYTLASPLVSPSYFVTIVPTNNNWRFVQKKQGNQLTNYALELTTTTTTQQQQTKEGCHLNVMKGVQ